MTDSLFCQTNIKNVFKISCIFCSSPFLETMVRSAVEMWGCSTEKSISCHGSRPSKSICVMVEAKEKAPLKSFLCWLLYLIVALTTICFFRNWGHMRQWWKGEERKLVGQSKGHSDHLFFELLHDLKLSSFTKQNLCVGKFLITQYLNYTAFNTSSHHRPRKSIIKWHVASMYFI